MVDKILTLHPSGNGGKNIEKQKYEVIKNAILRALRGALLTHTELDKEVSRLLPTFEGSLPWYVETVKLDLEARKVIERTYTQPPRYRLVM